MSYAFTRFHSIGQGCFYSGEIYCDLGRDPIRMIYDCGSETGGTFLEREITLYHRIVHEGRLDILVLSHLDADHVNGLPSLLDNSMRVKTVFLPYLTPIQRAVAAGNAGGKAGPEYFQLLADPVAFLEGRGVENIVFINGYGDDESSSEESNLLPLEPAGGGDDFPNIGDLEDDGEGKRLYYTNEPKEPAPKEQESEPELPLENSKTEEPDDLRPSNKAKLYFKTDRRRFHLAQCWQGKFMHKDDMQASLNAVNGSVDYVIRAGDTSTVQRYKRFLKEIHDTFRTFDSHRLVQAICNEADRVRLQHAYRHIRGNHNDVSLVLWHGPFSVPAISHVTSTSPQNQGSRSNWSANYNGGTLLSGDITCGTRLMDKMERHFAGLLDGSAFLHVPHHGSLPSWNDRLLSATRRRAIPVVCAGRRNPYTHPHEDVVMALNHWIGERYWIRSDEHHRVAMYIRTL